jgi:hypothetical protein
LNKLSRIFGDVVKKKTLPHANDLSLNQTGTLLNLLCTTGQVLSASAATATGPPSPHILEEVEDFWRCNEKVLATALRPLSELNR